MTTRRHVKRGVRARCHVCGKAIWSWADAVRTSFEGTRQYRHVDCPLPGPRFGRIGDSR